jgi:acyl-CoA thioesterase-1
LIEQEWVVIVALGDSLTVGFQSPFGYGIVQDHPYTMRLESLIRNHIEKTGINKHGVTIVNRGINSDSTDGMIARFPWSVKAEKPTHVIIWGGINDMSSGRPLEKIMENLSRLYEFTIDLGALPIACTLTGISGPSQANDAIQTLNQLIIQHCQENNILFADLYTATIDSEGALDQKYSNDGVHLSNLGYDVVADALFTEVFEKNL